MAFMPWATHTLQWIVQRVAKAQAGANPTKAGPSWDRRLQPACVNVESLVTAGQNTAVNTFPGLVHTARHVMEAENN